MGLFDAFKTKKPESEIKDIAVKPQLPDTYIDKFKIHDDIKYLLWFGDGPYKNLTREEMDSEGNCYSVGNGKIRISFSIGHDVEPSLIFINMPVKQPVDEQLIPRPPYYPQYVGLTPEQRWIYLKLLTDPYNTKIDIGYVFILYYGLERHLLKGDFDSAFKVIMKLRDVHKNSSFQGYSGNALILSALWKGKGEYIPMFINSLNNEYEYNFSENLLLMSYYSFNVPLLPRDIMRMAKSFDFTNMNYIKKNPDVFENNLTRIINNENNTDHIDLKKYFTESEINNFKRMDCTIYANTSFIKNKISIPLLINNMMLKTDINRFLTAAHEATKKELAGSRKKKRDSET